MSKEKRRAEKETKSKAKAVKKEPEVLAAEEAAKIAAAEEAKKAAAEEAERIKAEEAKKAAAEEAARLKAEEAKKARAAKKAAAAKTTTAGPAVGGEAKEKKSGRLTNAELAEMTIKLAAAVRAAQGSLDNVEDKLDDHESRIARLEVAVFPEKKAATSDGETAKEAEAKTEAASPSDTSATTATKSAEPDPVVTGVRVGYAYKYWHAETGSWGITSNIWAAKQASTGVYDPIWVWYDVNGHIDRLLTPEEVVRYTPA